MGLSADRSTPRLQGEHDGLPVKASIKVYAGALVATTSAGYVVPAGNAAAVLIRGRAKEAVDNSAGADGDLSVRLDRGRFRWDNSSAGDAIAAADVGSLCFAVDDHTVAKTIGAGNRLVAGKIVAVDTLGVWVETGEPFYEPRKVRIPFFINQTDLLAPTPAELISPVTGAITKIDTTVQVAITTGGTITAKAGTTTVAGLSVAIANAATKGTIGSGAPTSGDATATVAIDSRIQVVPAGFASAGAVSGFVEITY